VLNISTDHMESAVSTGVKKAETIYKPWSEDKPVDGNVVRINLMVYVLNEEDKEVVIEDSRQRQQSMPFSFVLGSTDVIEGINMAVRSFGQGARSKVKISSDLAYGKT
jgi:FKBP-type peptidyl-prolyl cis-trans isomerase 2